MTKLTVKYIDLPFAMVGAFLFCFLLSFVASSLIIQPKLGKAVSGLGLVDDPFLTLESSDFSVGITLVPTGNGALAAGQTSTKVSTNVPMGYKLSLVAADVSGPDGSNIEPGGGTVEFPDVLSNNTWGFALNAVRNSTPANTVINGFDEDYAIPTPSDTSLWANPRDEISIKSTERSSHDDATIIYYGMRADTSIAAGTYNKEVRYTAVANMGMPTPDIISVTPDWGSTAGGTELQIVGTGFTVNDESITTAVTLDNVGCLDVSISSNTPNMGQDTIYCITQERQFAGSVTVAVVTWGGTAIKGAGFNYVTPTPTIVFPTNGEIFDASTEYIKIEVTTDIPGICYFDTHVVPIEKMDSTDGILHTSVIYGIVPDSKDTIRVRCQAKEGHAYGEEDSAVFYVRAAMPEVPTLSPGDGDVVDTGGTIIEVTALGGARCTWGISQDDVTNASGTSYKVTSGTNTLYYSCFAGSGNTQSDERTGSWSFKGQPRVVQTDDPIQDVTKETCPHDIVNVYDIRDNHYYSIQRLLDGNCWMLTNLAYGGAEAGTQFTSGAGQSTTTNIAASSTAWNQANPPYNNQRQWVNPTTATVTQGGGATRCATAYRTSAASINYTECGFLYNWCAALGSSNGACAQASGNISGAGVGLCPSGWRLPTEDEYTNMYTAIGGTHADLVGDSSKWRGVYSGFFDIGNGLQVQDSQGYYWLSTAYSLSRSYYLTFDTYGVNPANSIEKYYGLAVRCITAS
jgi:uncharacterized protein (TIGR02145 family)